MDQDILYQLTGWIYNGQASEDDHLSSSSCLDSQDLLLHPRYFVPTALRYATELGERDLAHDKSVDSGTCMFLRAV